MKIALIAHDKKKDEIIELAKKYQDVLSKYELYPSQACDRKEPGGDGARSLRHQR